MTELIHRPYGQSHPYEQGADERFPRDPLAGESFTVGIVSRPSGALSRVQLWTQLNDGEPTPQDAIRIDDWQQRQEEGVGVEFLERMERIDQDVWQATLQAPPYGQTLTYWMQSGDLKTQPVTLRGWAWQRGGGWAHDGEHITLQGNTVPTDLPLGVPSVHAIEWLTDGITRRRVRIAFECATDEAFFGLGERFNALNQRGNVMDIRVYEQYKNQDKRTYFPIPFLISSAGYALWVQSSRWMQFDLAATDAHTWTLEADLGADEQLGLQWYTHANPLENIAAFSRQTGKADLPPLWTFGLWMSGNEWNTQARVIQEVQTSLDHDIPPAVMVIEAWSDETTFYIWNDAQYTPKSGDSAPRYSDFTFPPDGKWTDPKGMVDWLHARGVRVLLWQIPALKKLEGEHPQHSADHAHFVAHGYGVQEPDGTLHKIQPFWFRGGYVWDPTHADGREWWLNKRAYLLEEVGIDGFKTDGGEHIWGAQLRFGDGRAGDEHWNEYPLHYTEAYYQFVKRTREDGVLFSRAGFTGSQRAPLHWAGDENSTWDAFRHSILAGLSAGISGIPFWGWDLGGFSGETPTAELYLRGAAMAALCPVMQYHSEFNQHRENRDRTPWNIQARTNDARVIPLFRRFVNLRHNLLPYIWQEAQHSAATGEPMMRAARLWDAHAGDYDYFFGRDLFVSPVTQEGATAWQVRLPAGEWVDLWTGTAYSGGQSHMFDVPLETIPVFVRRGAVLPVNLPDGGTFGDAVPFSADATTHWQA